MVENNKSPAEEAVCQRVLNRYAPRIIPTRVESLGNRGGFSGAGIWRVVTDQGNFALRQWPREQLPPARILGLHRLLIHLYRDGLTFVAVPMTTADGKTLPHESGDDWQLEPWVPGFADFHTNPTDERLRVTMTALASWHHSAERHIPAAGSVEWFSSRHDAPSPAVGERLQVLDRINEPLLARIEKSVNAVLNPQIRELTGRIVACVRRGRNRIADELRSVCDLKVRLHPCLRDIWHDHLLFTGNELTGLIDPSASRTENVACDLSRLIGSLVGDDRLRWDQALNEYQRHRPLSFSELRLIEVLDHSGVMLSGWTWLEWIYLKQRTFSEAGPVISRLQTILERMDYLNSVS